MDRYLRLIYLSFAVLVVASCAELGTIEGGPKDELAPKPKENGYEPANGSIHFSSKKIVIDFDEYFKLNNPQENISILPTDLKITSEVEKKKLILNLEGDFQPNTTYQISFNNAIKDIHEDNDSLMHYVFSTGDYIDSLTYSGKLADAYTGALQSQFLVALYHLNDSVQSQKPTYFTKSDKEGSFTFEYLKAGKYKVYAFLDQNKDLKFQLTEKAGFRESTLSLDSSLVDSNAMLVFQSKLPAKITSKSFVGPNQIKLAANQDLRKTSWKYKDTLIDSRVIHFYSSDSLTFALPEDPASDFYLTSDGGFDTLFFRVNKLVNKIDFQFIPTNKDITEVQSVTLINSSLIQKIDTSLIRILALDSSTLQSKYLVNKNYVELSFPTKLTSSIFVTFLPKAILFNNGQYNDTLRETFTVKAEQEFGTLIFKTTHLPENAFIEILNSNKVVRQVSAQSLKMNPQVSFIAAGEFSFRVILDENQNGKWDGGDILSLKPAEKVLYFPQTVKVRANWETEVELEL